MGTKVLLSLSMFIVTLLSIFMLVIIFKFVIDVLKAIPYIPVSTFYILFLILVVLVSVSISICILDTLTTTTNIVSSYIYPVICNNSYTYIHSIICNST